MTAKSISIVFIRVSTYRNDSLFDFVYVRPVSSTTYNMPIYVIYSLCKRLWRCRFPGQGHDSRRLIKRAVQARRTRSPEFVAVMFVDSRSSLGLCQRRP
jgi:hypothetical protein